eukprot:472078_1
MALVVNELNVLIELFKNDKGDIQRIDLALWSYYTKMGTTYLTADGHGKFNTFCRNNNFTNNKAITRELSKTPNECILVLFDPHFPFAYDMELNERTHRIYKIIRSFRQFGGLFIDRFITKKTPMTLHLDTNRKRLIHGYIMQYSHEYIPSDIIHSIIRFCDHSHIWAIAGDQMDEFVHSQYRHTMYGPLFEVIDGMWFQITCCPMGWNVEGQVQVYLELKQFPHYIEDIMLSFLLFTTETGYEYQKTVTYHATGRRKAHGISQHAMTFNEIKEGKFDTLHIGCCIEIIHLRYTNPYRYQNVITKMPRVCDTELMWNMEMHELKQMQTANRNGKSLSITKTFEQCNCNCWILQFALHHDILWFYVKLLRLPFNTKSIQMKYKLTILYSKHDCTRFDYRKFELNSDGKAWLALNMDTERYKKGGKLLFTPSELQAVTSLKVCVKLQVTDCKSHNENIRMACVTHTPTRKYGL